VSARDRIGNGPWYNVKGVLIANNVAELHSDKANINNDTALDENGRTINTQGGMHRGTRRTRHRAVRRPTSLRPAAPDGFTASLIESRTTTTSRRARRFPTQEIRDRRVRRG
jgi:hypothetical protein